VSIQAVAWVLEHSEAKLADRLVLIAIANHADARGWNAWPSIPLIAAEARVEERTVYRALTALETLGELTVNRRPGRPSIYGITALMGCQEVRGGGSHPVRGPRHLVRPSPDEMSPEPSLTVNEPAAPPLVGLPAALPDDVKAKGAEFVRALRRGERPA
jgi:hypothetical protein